ncbi:MAG: pentapeptide repeat-containing protein [Candidatus Saccharibacteria bacterium]
MIRNNSKQINKKHLCADCGNCFGFCCAAFYFSASDGFPNNKDAGQACGHLQEDFRCGIHNDLKEKGYRGCMAYDCFGAGQRVAQLSFAGNDWRQAPQSAQQMFEVFLKMQQLHEMLWYLTEALTYEPAHSIYSEINSILEETDQLTHLSPEMIKQLEVAGHRARVNDLLLKASELVRAEARRGRKAPVGRQPKLGRGANLMGADLRKADLRGANLRGAYLIAADLRGTDLGGTDFIGADFRDTDIRGADLSHSIYLTQSQINSAKGDQQTKVPSSIHRPEHWPT